ncbi:DUF6273 domain-containing protein [Sphingobacterium detergens]
MNRKDGKLLIITNEIIEVQWYYNSFVDVTWENCTVRKYLNNELYNSFNENYRNFCDK